VIGEGDRKGRVEKSLDQPDFQRGRSHHRLSGINAPDNDPHWSHVSADT
jgi:hypothetical protein